MRGPEDIEVETPEVEIPEVEVPSPILYPPDEIDVMFEIELTVPR